jgi:LPXTG-motif cell wall-anchored protein
MIDISGRTVRAGIRSITAVATASCFVVMPQVMSSASAHTGGKGARAHDHVTPHRDHDGREARDPRRGRADLVVDTHGPRGAIVPGKKYKWPYEVTNRGTVPARDVALTARPDKHLKVLAAPPKCHWKRTGPLVCKIGLVPQGATRRGTITAELAPRARSGKALSNPVQVSWHNAPTAPEKRLAAFPPVNVSPGPDSAAPAAPEAAGADGKVPYPLMVTEHGPVTAESVVVRSPIGVPAPAGPCASGAAPVRTEGKAALGSCAARQDDPAACACGAAQDRPASERPAEDAVVPDRPAAVDAPGRPVVTPERPAGAAPEKAAEHAAAAPDRPAAAPCGAVAARPVVIPDRPVVPPCAAAHRPEAEQGRPAVEPAAPAAADRPATTPCGALAGRPVIEPARPADVPDRGLVPPCAAAHRPVAEQDRPAAVPADRPATTPCGAPAGRPVILPAPARPADVPDHAAAAPCAGAQGHPGAEQAEPAAADADKPGTKADADKTDANAPAAAPCGATAAKPVVVPGRPVAVPNMPAIPPCAQGGLGACGCLNSQNAPAAAPADPAKAEAAPCAAVADKPMAVEGKAASERPLAPPCGTADNAPAAVHEEPAVTPDTVSPMTPLAGPGKTVPGKAAHEPLGHPAGHHHARVPAGAPLGSGRAHRDCSRQGSGFVCPLGSAPHHRPHVVNLTGPSHPHALHCVGAAGVACHTRAAHPIAARPQPVRGNLPTTGSSSALLALSGLGLAGAGMVLYRLSRARRGEQG